MFGLFKKKNPAAAPARAVYAALLERTRTPVFYKEYGVADTFEGRFEVLVLHMFAVMHGLKDQDFNQALFDAAFADMDQSLRELGIGDMGVPKRMRRMMKGFNGRVHAYEAAGADELEFGRTLVRNVYNGVPEKALQAKRLGVYIMRVAASVKSGGIHDIMRGNINLGETP